MMYIIFTSSWCNGVAGVCFNARLVLFKPLSISGSCLGWKFNQAFALDIDPNHLPNVQDIKDRIAKHEQAIAIMEKTGQNQVLYTDPDARVMPAKNNGKKAC